MIAQAPWAFVTMASLIIFIVWTIVSHLKANEIKTLDSRLSLRDDEIAAYKRKLEGASPDEAASRIAALEQAIAELRPKRFSNEQIERLARELTVQTGEVSIIVEMGYADGQVLSTQLQDTFLRAGWQVSSGMIAGPPMRWRENVVVSVSGTQRSDSEKAVITALTVAKIPFALGPLGATGRVDIRVMQPAV